MAEVSSYTLYLGDKLIQKSFLGNDLVLYNPIFEENFIIRTDTNASSVTVAFPGTKFGNSFNQSSYRSDISGFINGGSSFADLPLTGSGQTTSTTTKWTNATDGYSTSMKKGTTSNMGAFAGNVSNINFGSSPFTVECWFNPQTASNQNIFMFFSYNSGCGFMNYSNEGYVRWTTQRNDGGETVTDFVTTVSQGTWYHIFMSRDANFWYGGFNGTIRAKPTLSGTVGTTAPFQFMGRQDVSETDVLFQDFRVTKGVCRYSGNIGDSYTTPNSIVTK